jgi:RNA polymerase sigma-B factor
MAAISPTTTLLRPLAEVFPPAVMSPPAVMLPPAATLPTAGGPAPGGVAGLDNQALLDMVHTLPWASERRAEACELLVSRHRGLVRFCAQRYMRGPESTEDLMQVGYVGLMKAINNFDPARGGSLAAYAQPTITGEIKRYFRDKAWPVHIKRSAQELVLGVRRATGDLTQELGRAPGDADLARYLGVSGGDLRDAQLAELAAQPSSLDGPAGGRPNCASLAELLGEDDRRVEHMLDMRAVATHWAELPEREREILVLRFRGDLTQAEIGRRLGISQMQVSRLLSHAFGYLRPRLLGLQEHTAEAALPARPARS